MKPTLIVYNKHVGIYSKPCIVYGIGLTVSIAVLLLLINELNKTDLIDVSADNPVVICGIGDDLLVRKVNGSCRLSRSKFAQLGHVSCCFI